MSSTPPSHPAPRGAAGRGGSSGPAPAGGAAPAPGRVRARPGRPPPPAPRLTERRPPPGRAPQPLPAARPQVQRVVRWALYAYICSIPFEMPGRSIPVEIPTLVGSVFLLATLLDRRAGGPRVSRPPPPLP